MKYLLASLGVVAFGVGFWLFGLAMFWIKAHEWAMWTAIAGAVCVLVYFLFWAFLEEFKGESGDGSAPRSVPD